MASIKVLIPKMKIPAETDHTKGIVTQYPFSCKTAPYTLHKIPSATVSTNVPTPG